MSGRTSAKRRAQLAALWIASVTLFMPGCGDQPDREPALAEAYVAPATLQLRAELVARSKLVATLKHGERVEIIGRRRRFYKLRTESGSVGWADSWQLLSPAGMEHLHGLAELTAEAPSQGQATVFDALNVHTVPNRQAPTIFQITPGTKVDVIAHQLVPKSTYRPPALLLPVLNQENASQKKPKQAAKYPPPPRPAPPAPPPNWIELSGGAPQSQQASPEAASRAPAVNEYWTLVRARDGRPGWVLARMLLMDVPDAVAQYAERARIAAFFKVGETVTKSGASHPAWLWATASRTGADYDCLRLFTWSTRRERYETSYIERNLLGFLPILIEYGKSGSAVQFSTVVSEKDGSLQTRIYLINGFRVRLAARRPATLPAKWYDPDDDTVQPATPVQSTPTEGTWRDRVPSWVPFIGQQTH